MTRVVAVGYQQGGFLREQPPVVAFPSGLGRDDLRALASCVSAEVTDGEDVVVVHPTWEAEPSLRLLQTVRAALGTGRVATYGTSLPPLAGSVLCGLAAGLGPLLPVPAALIAGLPAVERHLLAVSQLDRVDRMRHPRPDRRQWLASRFLPSTFGFSTWPHPHLRWLRPEDRTVALPPRDGWTGLPFRRLAVSAHRGAELDWVEEVVLPALGATDMLEMERSPLTAAYWGTTGVVEVVAYPTDLRALAGRLLEGMESRECPWCGAAVVSAGCPFCGVGLTAGLGLRAPA